jgi:hypothetical protein
VNTNRDVRRSRANRTIRVLNDRAARIGVDRIRTMPNAENRKNCQAG